MKDNVKCLLLLAILIIELILINYTTIETFKNKQLKFIHIPQTAGTSIEDIGIKKNIFWGRHDSEYCNNQKPFNHNHPLLKSNKVSPWYNFPSLLDDKIKRRFDWFMVVRNPYDRIISHGNYAISWAEINNKEQFNEYLRNKINIQADNIYGGHFCPQYKFLDNSMNIHILKFENLDDDFNHLMKRYNIKLTLSKKKNVGNKKYSKNDLDSDTNQLIKKIYKKDFEYFGYDSELVESFSNKLNHNRRVVFLTYGDQKFKESRDRIIKEAQALGFFTDTILETESVYDEHELKNEIQTNSRFKNVFNQKRGGGYWMWKPYIIYKNLLKLRDNDILIYSDAGSTVPNNSYTKNKLTEYIERCDKNNFGLIGFRLGSLESKWTRGDTFDYFNSREDKNIYNTNIINANIHVIRKCPESLKIYKLWWDIAKDKSDLFSNSPSITPNFSDFKENRHDQSIWSLICKTNNVDIIDDWKSVPIKSTRIRK